MVPCFAKHVQWVFWWEINLAVAPLGEFNHKCATFLPTYTIPHSLKKNHKFFQNIQLKMTVYPSQI